MEVKLAIVGSRTFNDYPTFNFVMNKICRENDYQVKQVISGGAVGTDTYGEQFFRAGSEEGDDIFKISIEP